MRGRACHLSAVDGSSPPIEVFTTRIDTIYCYWATFVLLAPEHPLVKTYADQSEDPVAFRDKVSRFRSQDRAARMSGEVEMEGFVNRIECCCAARRLQRLDSYSALPLRTALTTSRLRRAKNRAKRQKEFAA